MAPRLGPSRNNPLSEIRPFRINVPQAAIVDLHDRLDNARMPERETVGDRSQGVPLSVMLDLRNYWRDRYDWRTCEARLNDLGQSMTTIDGLDIHFLHIRSPHAAAMPMVLTHGWPGSVVEFLKVIGPLTRPADFAGDPQDAFHLVIPSLPGHGFSGKPTGLGWGIERIASAWLELMRRLGYKKFVAQGGDWGASVTTALADLRAPECVGIHLNLPVALPAEEELSAPGPDGLKALGRLAHYERLESGYAKIQSTRPQTLGYALADSTMGQAAWILEKFWAWSDSGDDLWSIFTRDELLDNVTLYWLTNSAASSARLYWESYANASRQHCTTLAAGCSNFPREILTPPRRWVERQYTNLVYWSEVDRGGHFAAMEQPTLFVREVRNCFRLWR
jgi:pimeloyl-ACP methyl ester carboxylesterase